MDHKLLEAKLRDEIRNSLLEPGFKYALCTIAMRFRDINNNDHYIELNEVLAKFNSNETPYAWLNSSLACLNFLNRTYQIEGCEFWDFKKEYFKDYCTRLNKSADQLIVNETPNNITAKELAKWIEELQKEDFISR